MTLPIAGPQVKKQVKKSLSKDETILLFSNFFFPRLLEYFFELNDFEFNNFDMRFYFGNSLQQSVNLCLSFVFLFKFKRGIRTIFEFWLDKLYNDVRICHHPDQIGGATFLIRIFSSPMVYTILLFQLDLNDDANFNHFLPFFYTFKIKL